ncbi:hypothetical protein [Microbacterium capsulatum]|uniref:Transcriptional regulator n=1 Tax=Microbacterium capsulatum TaxID=3041921 RepID=A0ABU0XFA3_9MICO|nr:hypothetical protein [Microbacterium sp. ASV81]MDQ4213778.1 hypothetical protein [Microbacterium sp. ASV81]
MNAGRMYELIADIVKAKVHDPNADIRRLAWDVIQTESSDSGARLVDMLNVLDTLGTFLGLHYATVSGADADRLAETVCNDLRFLGITGGQADPS